uniref:Uncharacterized protein n=1 Tax=Emiliania huxleyi TaxID=2903 RepID=A0A7S3TMN0_EMIHU
MPAAPATSDDHKKEGNELFAKGDFLRAAAAYTRGIKAAPDSHVLYSNRAQAFLRLHKVGKALEDADRCIALAPDFVKGYHRKASALHALGEPARSEEAAELLLGAIERGMEDRELVRLGVTVGGKAFAARLDAFRKAAAPVAPEEGDKPAAPPPPAKKAAPPSAAAKEAPPTAAAAAKGPTEQSLSEGLGEQLPWEAPPEDFAAGCLQPILKRFLAEGLVSLPAVVYLQPAPPAKGSREEPSLGQISIKPAFASPSTLAQCADFLQGKAAEARARSAVLFVRKALIEYPCVWKEKRKQEWPFDAKADGLFMQCESHNDRVVYFTQLTESKGGVCSVGETVQLDPATFALMPRLFAT